jgi:WD40 repeat protein
MNTRVIRFETGNPLHALIVDVSPDRQRLLVGQQGDAQTQLALGLWSLPSGKLEAELIRAQTVMPNAGRFSPDGRSLAFTDENQDLTLYDLASRTFDRQSFPLRFTKWLSFAGNRNRLVAGGTRTQVFDVALARVVFTLPVDALAEHASIEPPGCALSPDGERLAASGVEPGRIVVYDLTSGDIVRRIEGAMDDARSMTFDPTGKFLAATARLGGAGLWNVETGAALLPELINMAADYYWRVAFHPDGKHIGFGLWSGFVEVIAVADGSYAVVQPEEPAHHGRVNDIVFSRDGARMFTVGDDGAVLIWELT